MKPINRAGERNALFESGHASGEETLYLLRSPANSARLLDAVRGLEAGGGERELIEPED